MPFKGKSFERICQKMLDAEGFRTERAQAAYAYVKGFPIALKHDMFGCLDILALKADTGIWMLQMTTENGVSPRRRKLEEFAAYVPPELLTSGVVKIEVWVCVVTPHKPTKTERWRLDYGIKRHRIAPDGQGGWTWQVLDTAKPIPREFVR